MTVANGTIWTGRLWSPVAKVCIGWMRPAAKSADLNLSAELCIPRTHCMEHLPSAMHNSSLSMDMFRKTYLLGQQTGTDQQCWGVPCVASVPTINIFIELKTSANCPTRCVDLFDHVAMFAILCSNCVLPFNLLCHN